MMIRRGKKILASVVIGLTLVSLFSITNVFAATKYSEEENAKYKEFIDKECTKTDNPFVYIRKSDGKYFGISSDTTLDDVKVSNETISFGDYFADGDGSLIKNQWRYILDGGTVYFWHYYDSNYKTIKQQYKTIDGKKYYFDKEGRLSIGWKKRTADENIKANANDKHWYYFGEDGSITGGWIQSGGKWYYIYSDGLMAYDTTTPDGYYVNKNGVFVN